MSIQQLALSGAAKIKMVGNQAKAAFIDRDALVEALEWAFASGEHLVVLGPPGTSKSSVVRYFSEGLGLGYFRKLLNPDTTRDELVGPLDPNAMDRGEWDRAWAGLAKQPVVFLDEVGKASSQVVNMTLDAMEERLVSTPTHDRSISLHTLVGASNETLADDSAAAWDRFAIRVRVRRLDESSKVVSMWTRNRGKRQAPEETRPAATPVGITTDELKAMRSMVAWMAENVSDAVCEMGAQMWSGIQAQQTLRVSDRRWERLMQVAAGRALILGRTEVLPEDLTVARHMLWESVDSIDAVAKFV